MTSDPIDPVLREIEDAHQISRAAFQAHDLKTYMDIFALDLSYRQPDGKTIGRDQLQKDVSQQFNRLSAARWDYARESFQSTPAEATETLSQTAWLATTAFGVIHRLWRLERRGNYTWRRKDNRWQIALVEVVFERVVAAGVQVGLRPRLPALRPTMSDAA